MGARIELSLRDGGRIDRAEELLAEVLLDSDLCETPEEAAKSARLHRNAQIDRAVREGHSGSELARRVVASLNREAWLLEAA